MYDFGDGFGWPKSTSASATHAFSDPGEYTIVVLVTDQNSTIANVTASGKPCARFMMTIEVEPNQDAFQLVAYPTTYSAPASSNTYILPSSVATTTIAVQVTSYLSTDMPDVTPTFITVGERPRITFGNTSISALSAATAVRHTMRYLFLRETRFTPFLFFPFCCAEHRISAVDV